MGTMYVFTVNIGSYLGGAPCGLPVLQRGPCVYLLVAVRCLSRCAGSGV